MLISDLLTKIGVIAGMNDFTGQSVDVNYDVLARQILEQTINDINNDNQFATEYKVFDTQKENIPSAKEYDLPEDVARVERVFYGVREFRKTDYMTVLQMQMYGGGGSYSRFATNGNKLYLTFISPAQITYVPKVKIENNDSEIIIDNKYVNYIIYQTAFNLALAFSTGTVETCKVLVENSYATLMHNMRSEIGNQYTNPYTSLNRFNPALVW